MTAQLDLLDLLAELDPPAPAAAPQIPARIYAYRARTVAEYRARFDQWCNDNPERHFGSLGVSHGWHSFGFDKTIPGQCDVAVLSADLRCNSRDHYRVPCECVGGLVWLAICEHCGWHSAEAARETRVVVDGLDHAYPGWRDNPIAPETTYENTMQKNTWQKQVLALYGDRRPGWPVITDRTPPGLRSVPGRSPWGGYDVAVQSLTTYPAAP